MILPDTSQYIQRLFVLHGQSVKGMHHTAVEHAEGHFWQLHGCFPLCTLPFPIIGICRQRGESLAAVCRALSI